ncbi:hypothetical protein ASZ90_019451 [hydrocarbon metagenome]|uniref:Uncharacterized protein n=1 Tax=hydrocarbon metagenome TaxID=938273 RepID=A0A0W8E351_9ZZZZ
MYYHTFNEIIVNRFGMKGPFKGMNCHLGNRKYNYFIENI